MNQITILQGDITKAATDAIVNAANPAMLGGGGVDGAIHRAAGPALLEECRKVPEINGIRCPTGEARVTGAGDLKARYVIHTAGPVYRKEQHPGALLALAYSNCCRLALEKECSSIAFPAISCGVYGFPYREATEIALKTCTSELFSALDITFYLFNTSLYEIYCETFSQMTL